MSNSILNFAIMSQDTYRIFMLPISFIVATAYPVVDMRVFLDDPSPTTDNIKDLSSVKKVIRLQAVSDGFLLECFKNGSIIYKADIYTGMQVMLSTASMVRVLGTWSE